MSAISTDERREVARRLRGLRPGACFDDVYEALGAYGPNPYESRCLSAVEFARRLADLIEPSYKPSVEYEAWYNGLVGWAISRDEAKTVRELIEEIVWTALTVDLGPNGNTDSTGVDEGRVYTDSLFAEWEREALRLSGGIDRAALLALADKMEGKANDWDVTQGDVPLVHAGHLLGYADRIREALGVVA